MFITFRLLLADLVRSLKTNNQKVVNSKSGNEKRILIIEDEKIVVNMYTTRFEDESYTVLAARDGFEGLQLARREKPDLILLDIILPRVDGFSVLGRLKKDLSTKNIPVLLLTNLGQEEDQKKAVELGAAGYLVKASHTPTQVIEKAKSLIK